MSERPTRRPEDHLVEALALLDEVGPASQSLGISIEQLSESLGVHRSTVHRRWETIGNANDDVVEVLASAATWRARLLARDPAEPLVDVLDAVFEGPRADLGTFVRALVAGWSPDHPARRRLAALESQWLASADEWWAHHLRAHGRAPSTFTVAQLSLAIAALIEGNGLLHLAMVGDVSSTWDDADRRRLVARIAQIVDHGTEPGRIELGGAARFQPVEPPSPAPPLDKVLDLARAAAVPVPEPRRLVDPRRLATRTSVTERRLYALWPTTADMNGDLAVAVVERSRAELAAMLAEMIDVGASGDGDGDAFLPVLISCVEAVVTQNLRAEGATYLSVLSALMEPTVRARTAEPLGLWLEELRTVFLAGQALSRARRRPDVAPEEFAAVLRETVVGLQRFVVTDPSLAEGQTVLEGEQVPVVGVLPLLVATAFVIAD